MQVKANTNREVKPGGLPSGVGCNVVSTYTAYTIYRACYEGIPSIERVVTVAEHCVPEAQNLLCRFGTPLEHIFKEAGADIDQGRAHLHGRTHDGHRRGGPHCRQRQGRKRPAVSART